MSMRPGRLMLPSQTRALFTSKPPDDEVRQPLFERLQAAIRGKGGEVCLTEETVSLRARPPISIKPDKSAPANPGAYAIDISSRGITLAYREVAGLRAGVATLCQLLRQYGRRLPCLVIRDWPDFPRRGVMLDVSRGRVPKVETLMELADYLANFKINELQLYLEHTFAYRGYEDVWRSWGALTSRDIRMLDLHCRRLGIDLVPNQNSFGHMRHWLEHPRLKHLAEVDAPWEDANGSFLRYPATLSPVAKGTLPFLRSLYDELLPNFSSRLFNVGCDETWDLGRGRSQRRCQRIGKGRVYLEFLQKIHREVSRRNRRMMFWADIVLQYPKLIPELPSDLIAINWGYEAGHPFEQQTAALANARVPFYVCPGTSTWMSLIGRHDNAFTNLREAAHAGRRHGARGYLIADWGDGGHPQPLAVSYPLYVHGAALSWCAAAYDPSILNAVLDREVYRDARARVAGSAVGLGLAHTRFGYAEPNVTPFGAVLAAPPPSRRELFCRDGLKYYARIPAKNIHRAMEEVETRRRHLSGARPRTASSIILSQELDLAARLALQSCQYMLWQQALAGDRHRLASQLARRNSKALQQLRSEFNALWPGRNKGRPGKCSAFFGWRLRDYRHGKLHFSPEVARQRQRPVIG